MGFSSTAALALLACSTAQAVWIAGVNIAGCDFGMDPNGNYNPGTSFSGSQMCPTSDQAKGQMQHFQSKDKFNVFRFPVAWQSLVGNDLETNKLDENFMTSQYDPMIQACIGLGAHCIVEIHNYARWWGQVVGQGGPADSSLATTWSQLAGRYKSSSNVFFGVMNEPHDLNMDTWANTVQASVTAIRQATGNNNNIILLSGTNFDALGGFSSNSEPALSRVSNPDGSKTNLIYEVHQYFDSDTSGTHTECSHDASGDFSSLAGYLRGKNRQAMVTELGGGNNQGCADLINKSLDVINNNADIYIGWTSWSAGAFPSTYELYEVPGEDGSDQFIVANAFAPKFAASQ